MKVRPFQKLLASIPSLTSKQLDELMEAGEDRRRRAKAMQAVETAQSDRGCAHCASAQVVRNGNSRGLQRYLCKDCGRTFNATTGTALTGLHHKERLFEQGKCLVEGMTVRDSAAQMGVSVSTAFRLRHRFLQGVVEHQPAQVAGILETDETYFRESQKGSRHLTRPARARGGKATAKGAPKDLVPVLVSRLRGQRHVADRVLKTMTADQATKALRDVVGPDTLLCIDGSGALRKAAAELGVTTKSIAVGHDGRVMDGVYHVQSANSYHERLKSWLERDLRGVSTKYLPHYLAWMRVSEWFKSSAKPEHFVISGLGKQLINT